MGRPRLSQGIVCSSHSGRAVSDGPSFAPHYPPTFTPPLTPARGRYVSTSSSTVSPPRSASQHRWHSPLCVVGAPRQTAHTHTGGSGSAGAGGGASSAGAWGTRRKGGRGRGRGAAGRERTNRN